LKKFFLANINLISSATVRFPHPRFPRDFQPNPPTDFTSFNLPQGERGMRGRSQFRHRLIFRMKCKKILCICIILVLVLLTVGCEKSEVQILEGRVDAFRNILPEKVREEFDSKNYEKVVIGLDSLLEHDSNFKEEYQKLKDRELINVFSTKEVVDFFKVYFVEEIERLKKEKQKRW
jgi:hypothetical protein